MTEPSASLRINQTSAKRKPDQRGAITDAKLLADLRGMVLDGPRARQPTTTALTLAACRIHRTDDVSQPALDRAVLSIAKSFELLLLTMALETP